MNMVNSGRSFRRLPTSISGRFGQVLAVAFLFCLGEFLSAGWVLHASEPTLVFVEPDVTQEGPPLQRLDQVPVCHVRGGRAFSFRIVAEADWSPLQSRLARVFAESAAIKHVLGLLQEARRLGAAPAQQWLIQSGPIPVWIQSGGRRGPGMFTLVPIRVTSMTRRAFESSNLLVLADLEVPGKLLLRIEDQIPLGLLVPMVCHELLHAAHAELSRERFLLFSLLAASFGGRHDLPDETDPQTSFREGFAEAGEAWLSRRYAGEFQATETDPTLDPRAVAFARELARRRWERTIRNRYIYVANGRIRDGRLKPGHVDHATEGVTAALVYTILAHADLPDPWRNLMTVMAQGAPLTLFDLVKGLLRQHPDRATVLRRILLEYTRYTVASPEAAQRYEAYYLARKAFLQQKADRASFERARQEWQIWKEEQFRRISAGAPLLAAVPQPLVVTSRAGFDLDLNDPDPGRLAWHLEAFLPAASGQERARQAKTFAARLLDHRRVRGGFSSIQDIQGGAPGWLVDTLTAGHRRHLARIESLLRDELAKRRHLQGRF
jgi:hypothetical protein